MSRKTPAFLASSDTGRSSLFSSGRVEIAVVLDAADITAADVDDLVPQAKRGVATVHDVAAIRFQVFAQVLFFNHPLRYQTLALVGFEVEGKLLPPEITARRQGSWLVVFPRMWLGPRWCWK